MKDVRKTKKKKAEIKEKPLACDYCEHNGNNARVIFRNILNNAGICSACVELFMIKLLQLETDTPDKSSPYTRH